MNIQFLDFDWFGDYNLSALIWYQNHFSAMKITVDRRFKGTTNKSYSEELLLEI